VAALKITLVGQGEADQIPHLPQFLRFDPEPGEHPAVKRGMESAGVEMAAQELVLPGGDDVGSGVCQLCPRQAVLPDLL
jgi:hypothetical protein